MSAGLRMTEANEQIDAIDTQLGMDGRTLPEDASASVLAKIAHHRAAQQPKAAATPAPGPRFESPAPSAEQRTVAESPTSHPERTMQPSPNAVPTLAELAAGQAATARPQFVTPTPASPGDASADASEPRELTPVEKRSLKSQAVTRARSASSPERVAEWLVRKGMTEEEASTAANNAWQRAVAQRKQAEASRRGDQTMAWLEIVAGVALLIGGLAAGWFVGLFVFIIIDGFRRLGSA